MTASRTWFVLLAVLLFLAFASAALCAEKTPEWEFGLFASQDSLSGGIDIQPESFIRVKTEPGSGVGVDFRIGYHFKPFVALEIGLAALGMDYEEYLWVSGVERTSVNGGAGEQFHVDLVLVAPRGHVRPYAKVGWARADINSGGIVGDQRMSGAEFGAGLKLFVARRWTLRLEASQFSGTLDGQIGWLDINPGGPGLIEYMVPFSDELTLRKVSFGVSFFL
jgi:hypothetical protein